METRKAVMAFSQSEKIKAGLIWLSQALELLRGLPEAEKKGGERVLGALLQMITQEVSLAGNLIGGTEWEETARHMARAADMVHSGVGQEATVHLSRALSRITNIGRQSMTWLREQNIL